VLLLVALGEGTVRAALFAIAVVLILTGCAAGKSSRENTPPAVPERSAVEERAWDELSSILLGDLFDLNDGFHESLGLARDIGANVSIQSQVQYNEWEQLSDRLKAWRTASSAAFPAYWDELASAALAMSDALAKYAWEGDEYLLAVADAAQERLNATVDEHCQEEDYVPLVGFCK
jgi:hypothetical protein